ncbi:phage baseplate assembly protein V [Enterobacter asburiae]|uniref:phage baseplate assembly protein V n=1 Tax=Enterobacter asburiae TaxID=61645 RepID=UPI001CC003B4|nr:phage baseplate assembly protein V [Enterobacter asburiae]UAN18427.1 phage baseplate assembly protein V [Enterobacter asburiae]
MNLNELYRLICNLARVGTVLEVDTGKYLARVETGENKTDWIRWAVPRAGEAVTWWAPTVGEQVYILCPCGEMETAFIAGSLYSEDAPPPDAGATTCVILHPDGARISYDPEASALVVSGVKTADVTASGSVTATVPVVTVKADTRVTLDTPEVLCTGNLKTATFEVTGGGKMNGAFTGVVTFNGVKPDLHDHGNVQSGGSWTKGIK